MIRATLSVFILMNLSSALYAQDVVNNEIELVGVYQGKTLFLQNPYLKSSKSFCIDKVYINQIPQNINNDFSAIKINFDGFDLNTPVRIRILSKDSTCTPVIINPEAVLFHTIFRFNSMELTDTAFYWSTKGERGLGTFIVEKLKEGIWEEHTMLESSGIYEGADYVVYPNLNEGANKFRIKYNFPVGQRVKYLYSWEVEKDFYLAPVSFSPRSVKSVLTFSRHTPFEIYKETKLIYSGEGKEVNLRGKIRSGEYVIYFDGKDPGTFIKE